MTVTAINMVGMSSDAFSNAVIVDQTPPKAGMVVDLSSVYRIDASSTEKTVSMNSKICVTDEGKYISKAPYNHTIYIWNKTRTVRSVEVHM